MAEPVREWPPALDHALRDVRPVRGVDGCYLADADLTKDEILLLNIFEARARFGHIRFRDPATARDLVAYLNTSVSIGPPRIPRDGAVRVRIALSDVHPH
ncbi:MAG: hypothetical protein ABWY78_00835 [Microvirga sp.]|jgi:hypothetical protein